MQTSEQINEIATALAKAQGELKPAVKDAVNPAYRSKYADLASVWAACHEAFPKHGIAIVQDLRAEDGCVSVITRLAHASGQWMEFGPFHVPLAKQDAHGVGSAATYAKRYALCAAVGVSADEDDDGNAAVGETPAPRSQTKKPPYTGSEPPFEYKPPRAVQSAPRGVQTVQSPVLESAISEENREFYLGAIRRAADKYKLTPEERMVMQEHFLDGQNPGKADLVKVHKLYLFLGDDQGVKDWRNEQKSGATA